MIYPSIKSLLEKIDNKYSLVVIASKRARQIVDGGETSIDIQSNNPVTIATNEIILNAIKYETTEV